MAKEKLRKFFSNDFKKLLPQLYLGIIILGLVLTLLFTIFPSLQVCSSIFGDDFCTPTGLFIGMIASIPGYLIVGNVLGLFQEIPLFISLILVVLVSFVIYFAFGLLLDKAFKGNASKSTKSIVAVFIMLALAAVFLYVLSGMNLPIS